MENETSFIATQPSPLFNALVRSFLAEAGYDVTGLEESAGAEISVGELTARIHPHPNDDAVVVIDIEATQLDPDDEDGDSTRWLLMHRLNAEARFTTGWLITVEDDTLLLTQSFRIADIGQGTLGDLLIEGVERAELLRSGFLTMGATATPGAGGGEETLPAEILIQRA